MAGLWLLLVSRSSILAADLWVSILAAGADPWVSIPAADLWVPWVSIMAADLWVSLLAADLWVSRLGSWTEIPGKQDT